MVQPRLTFISDIPEMLDFVDDLGDYEISLFEHKKMKTDAKVALAALEYLTPYVAGICKPNWYNEYIYNVMNEVAGLNGLKGGQVLWAARVALSGKAATPCGASEIAALLGKDETVARLNKGIEKLRETDGEI
jgi:glutamyl-tRNA synthetase